ncbi:MAG: phage terminase large subunit family protein [Clostridiales bacterium]|jgi:DNA-directed RNA polymerase subunit RPC12/RpoP|nr:phage terminase large subunit family protein [Clostridiales bacterium]
MPSYDKSGDRVIFAAEESEANRCPVCGREPMYDTRNDLDDSIGYPWNCECGASGTEFEEKVFDGHYVNADTIPDDKLVEYKAGNQVTGASDNKVLFRVEYEITPIRQLAVRCPHCMAWMRSGQASADAIPDIVVAEFARYKCSVCGLEFCPVELGRLEIEECGSAEQVYRDCAN